MQLCPSLFPLSFRLLVATAAVLMVSPPTTASEGDLFPGPVQARVIRVIDGDTFAAEARIWPGQVLTVSVRLRGIDAPELRSRCEAEREAARRAARALMDLIDTTSFVTISNIGSDTYYGRVVADVATKDGEPVAAHLLEARVVRAYRSGARADWCSRGVLTGFRE